MLPFFYGSVTLWTGFGIVGMLVPETEFLVAALILASILEGVMAVRFLLIRAPRKVRELRDASPEKSR